MTADELYQHAFRSEIAALQPASLCDVGCGAGALVAHVQSLGLFAIGIEPDAAKVAEGSAADLDIRQGSAEALPFPDDSFDLVTFENSLHHVTEIDCALAEAMRVARRAVVIVDPWFDLSIPSQALCDRFERWLKKLDRMTGMVHWDPIPAGEIIGALANGKAPAIAVRHLLQLTPMTPEAFEHLVNRVSPQMSTPAFSAAYEANGMDKEITAIRHEFARIGITESGALLVTITK
ncbi:MAG TPA: class I SAM-dependent methyltransferase [Dongiaceae bacterium]|jgi:ubiquinone/menaquinone biosynthesis C-methylase UbiE|nr:class I SAM-dependent methyltransferase [Dongiaceae bacterium]